MFVFDNQCLNTAKLVCEDIEWIQECNFSFISSSSNFGNVERQCSLDKPARLIIILFFGFASDGLLNSKEISANTETAMLSSVPLLLHIDPVDWKPPMSLMGKERNYPHSTFKKRKGLRIVLYSLKTNLRKKARQTSNVKNA